MILCPLHSEPTIGILTIILKDASPSMRTRHVCAKCLSDSALYDLRREIGATMESLN